MPAYLAIAIGLLPAALVLAGPVFVTRGRLRAGVVVSACGVALAATLWIAASVMGANGPR